MDKIEQLYLSGLTIEEVAAETGLSIWTVRSRVRKLGISRPRKVAIKLSKRKPNRETRNDGYLDKLEKKEAALYIKANQLFKPIATN
ncbi:hypothetical protein [Shewanella xiamenensis]|uniref:hypothetical protein n=1 Tax=Shewanella xiamenensis TaxID=332186 RepID=UPI00217DAA6B|nr:hypothetical protein [Shewanella xiamenensis]MCT8874155.1 hypothetical protein [Shewanella xiamenensis]UWH42826.1 hypothetical protein KXJ80_06085 [Shewanella xiamenensis]